MRIGILTFLALSACQKDCPEGQARDNDGNCVDVADADTDADSDSDADTDTDADSDADTDTDADSDADTDTDTDSDADYTVCDDGIAPFSDIQSAIDASAEDDVITVCAGTWTSIDVSEHDLTIVGVEGAEDTLLFGTAEVVAVHVEDVSLDLSGFTLRGAKVGIGAALWTEGNASVSLHDARLAENSASPIVYHQGDQLTWDYIVVEDNVFSGDPGLALAIDAGAGPVEIAHSIVRNNENAVNLVTMHKGSIHNSIFAHNQLASGSLVQLWSGNEVEIYNNVFYDTTTTSSATVVLMDFGTLQNNIIAESGANVYTVGVYNTPSINYNDLWNNEVGDTLGGNGNLAQNPAFTDAASDDFTLEYGYSACTDAGNPNAGYNDTDGTRNDMGAYGGPYGSW